MPDTPRLAEAARSAFARRADAHAAFVAQAGAIVAASAAMAPRFAAGGKLLAFGVGGPTTDAEHVAVEFVHPVTVGRRALPAVSLAADTASALGLAGHRDDGPFAQQLRVLGTPADLALAVAVTGDEPAVLDGLRAARRAGLLTVAFLGGDGGAVAAEHLADHVVIAGSDDPHVVKELHVCGYHVLWETVHVFLDHPGGPAGAPAAGSVEALYPGVYAGAASLADLTRDATASAVDKLTSAGELRQRVGTDAAETLAAAARDLAGAFADDRKLLTCGNGGSSSDAQALAHAHLDPPVGWRALPALCLTNDVALVTALGNDVAFDVVFARQVRAFGGPGDVLVGLSTSGNSTNLLRAFEQARALGMVTVGFAGGDGGAMAAGDVVDHLVVVPTASVHRVQEVQTTCYHVLRELVEVALDGRDG